MSQAVAPAGVRWRLGPGTRKGGLLGLGDLIFPPVVSPTALLVAMVLAVFKPWGRIRPSRGGTR